MILLDDADSSAEYPTSRFYCNPLLSWSVLKQANREATDKAIDVCLDEISASTERGEYIIAAFAYELGIHLQGLESSESEHPLIQAWSFSSFEALSKKQVDQWISNELANLKKAQPIAGIANCATSIDCNCFIEDIARIQDYITAGDAYQINHTYRIHGDTYGAPLALYSRLRQRQPGRYAAFIQNGDQYLLSQSPELFIQRCGDVLRAMPMKGTANAERQTSSSLSQDPKNQAENVMIVDLLRNDLSRIAITGSVTVPSLFDVMRYGDVLQMTSTVEAIAKPNLSLRGLLEAVFPCGSVTGAPKKRSMQIIQELEKEPRGYYCGALGWLDPSGDFAFNVPIRTIEMNQIPGANSGRFVLGVGAGITSDSNARQEWDECQVKSSFLINLPSATGLFETILVIGGQLQRLESHLDRIENSALALNIPFDRVKAKALISSTCSTLDAVNRYRIRLDLSENGHQSISKGLLELLPPAVKIHWAKDVLRNPGDAIVDSGNLLIRHKISSRALYDKAWQSSVSRGGFDSIFTNEKGFVTEGGRSNIFIQLKDGGEWLTPPLTSGLLPGVSRSSILADPNWNARQADLRVDDVLMARDIMLTNALRGTVPAYL